MTSRSLTRKRKPLTSESFCRQTGTTDDSMAGAQGSNLRHPIALEFLIRIPRRS
jgi:hypothetical protein